MKIRTSCGASLSPPNSRLLCSRMAKLAFCRVSAAFKKASSPQALSMLLPPWETKGSVTPVRGSRSTAPKMLSTLWNTSSDMAAQAAMV